MYELHAVTEQQQIGAFAEDLVFSVDARRRHGNEAENTASVKTTGMLNVMT